MGRCLSGYESAQSIVAQAFNIPRESRLPGSDRETRMLLNRESLRDSSVPSVSLWLTRHALEDCIIIDAPIPTGEDAHRTSVAGQPGPGEEGGNGGGAGVLDEELAVMEEV